MQVMNSTPKDAFDDWYSDTNGDSNNDEELELELDEDGDGIVSIDSFDDNDDV